jgi:hypothetical protein
MWQDGNRVLFTCQVLESSQNCLTGGWVELADGSSQPSTTQMSQRLKSDQVFQEIKARVSSQPEIVSKIGAIYQWNILKDGKTASTWSKSGILAQ